MIKRKIEEEMYGLKNKYAVDDLALDEVVKRSKEVPDSTKKQKE